MLSELRLWFNSNPTIEFNAPFHFGMSFIQPCTSISILSLLRLLTNSSNSELQLHQNGFTDLCFPIFRGIASNSQSQSGDDAQRSIKPFSNAELDTICHFFNVQYVLFLEKLWIQPGGPKWRLGFYSELELCQRRWWRGTWLLGIEKWSSTRLRVAILMEPTKLVMMKLSRTILLDLKRLITSTRVQAEIQWRTSSGSSRGFELALHEESRWVRPIASNMWGRTEDIKQDGSISDFGHEIQ